MALIGGVPMGTKGIHSRNCPQLEEKLPMERQEEKINTKDMEHNTFNSCLEYLVG